MVEWRIICILVGFEERVGTVMNKIFLSSLLLIAGMIMQAQKASSGRASLADNRSSDSNQSSEWEIEQAGIEEQLEMLSSDYSFPNPTADPYDSLLTPQRFPSSEVPEYSADVISERLYNLPMVISMDYNRYVQRYIEVYTVHRREQVSRMLGLAHLYFPIFEEELDRMGMPLELKYLSVVESALNPHARSRVGATGLWQFMLGTARVYGLKVDSYVDERKDPYKSTIAAFKYLKNSYNEFGDWLLAIASYNCGPGNVRKAIRRSGGQMDFWKIREYLPRETRGYVPAFIAATYVFNYAADHNIFPEYPEFSLETDTIHLKQIDITLAELSDALAVDLDLLRNHNPELKLDRIPYTAESYVLRVPPETAVRYASQERELRGKYGQKRDQLPPEVAARYAAESAASTSSARSTSTSDYSPPAGTILVYYTVRNGDVVGSIAEKYGVSARQIANWNNLRRYRIRVGQKLKIYTTQQKAEQAGARTAQERRQASVTLAPTAPAPVGQAVYHKAVRGDTLWGIATKYPDVSLSQIQALNPGLDASDLKIGMNIRIK